VLGTFCVYQRTPATPSSFHQSLIAHAIQIASIAIERSQIESALRRSETLLAEGQRLSQTGSFSWRTDTEEIVFSDELRRIFEFDPTTVLTLDLITARVHPLDLPLVQKKLGVARSGGRDLDYEVRLQMPDGRVKHLHTFAHGVVHGDGRLEVLGAMLDITRRRLAEETLDKVRSEHAHVTRVLSLGVLTASIAHEVNQPLTGILTNASTCLRMLAANPPNIEGALETARRTIRDGNRAADVITHLRALFSKKATATETVDLNEATREVLALVYNDLFRNRVILRIDLDEDPLLVTGDRVQLQQVILNLIRNASDAMSGVNDRPRHLFVTADIGEEGHARLTVKDAGLGLEPQSADRLFAAFYTTKDDGMGIGLSVSRSIIESHGGRLWVEPNDGPGTTFAFSIPRQIENAAQLAYEALA
jgi:signal transduction histidine kinase